MDHNAVYFREPLKSKGPVCEKCREWIFDMSLEKQKEHGVERC